ncbi:MAG: DUF881 domain-containing protein [Janthinobacterium lividum]
MSPVSTRLRLTIAALTITAAVSGVFLVSSTPAQVSKSVATPSDQSLLSQAQFLAGLTPVQGPGVIVTLTDSKKLLPKVLPSGIAPPNIIHDTDINQVLNELKAAGAEAIAVNGQRIVTTSAVRCAGRDVYVNNTPLLAPYTIKAIGDSRALETALNIPGGIASQIKQYDKTMFAVQAATLLTLPAYAVFSQMSLSQAQFLAALTTVQGHGVVVTLNDSKKPFPGGLPAGIAPPNLIHDTDINQVVNELKAAGVEAISINNQRLVATSAVRYAGPTIFINNTAQAPPYVIKAIGEPKTLEAALNISGGIASQIKQFDKAMFSDREAAMLTLPAYAGTAMPRYAKPAEFSGQAQAPGSDVARTGLLTQRSRFATQLEASRSERDSLKDRLQTMRHQVLQKAITISQSRPPVTMGPNKMSTGMKTHQSEIVLTKPVAEALSELRKNPHPPVQVASQNQLKPTEAKIQFLHDVHTYQLKWIDLYNAEANSEAETRHKINVDRLIQHRLQDQITRLDKQFRKQNETVPAN